MFLLLLNLFQLFQFGYIPEHEIIVSEDFCNADEVIDWRFSGTTFCNDGLRMESKGEIATATYIYATALGEKTTSINFQILEDGSVFGLGFNDFENMGFGTLVLINSNNRIRVASWNGKQDFPDGDAGVEKELGASLEKEKWYTLKIEKLFGKNIIVLLNENSKVLVKMECEQGQTSCQTGRQWGQPTVFCKSGSISIRDFTLKIPYYKPDFLILGDSNVEGPIILKGDYKESWAYLLRSRSELSIAIAGRGGDESTNVLSRLDFELDRLRPRAVLIAIGTNDKDHEVWRKNLKVLIERIEKIGAQPILCTLLPKPNQVFKTLKFNEDIRSGFFGSYAYIDLAKAVSRDARGKEWIKGYSADDKVHASKKGMEAIFNYLEQEYKSLFRITAS